MAYVNFNRGLTRAQIEALTNAVNGKIYFATDGGIYVGKADGTAEEKADINYRTESKTGQEFVYRKSPATIKAKSLTLDRIYGKTLAWNQIYRFTSFPDSYGTYCSYDTATNTFIITNATRSYFEVSADPEQNIISGHKYYLAANVIESTSGLKVFIKAGESEGIRLDTGSGVTSPGKYRKVHTATVSGAVGLTCWVTSGESIKFQLYLTDLTLLYGSEIDGMTDEQILAKFEREFPGYHDFGNKLISNDASAIETTGFNKWDEEWELGIYDYTTGQPTSSSIAIRSKDYTPIFPSTAYFFKVPGASSLRILWYDANKNFISTQTSGNYNNTIQTSPANACFMRIGLSSAYGTTYNHDICINLSDPAKNGTYEPYRKTTMQLNLSTLTGKKNGTGSSVVIFPDGLRSAGNVYDEIVGSKAIKRIGKVDLGTQSWEYASFSGTYVFFALVSDASYTMDGFTSDSIQVKYKQVYTKIGAAALPDKQLSTNTNQNYVYVRDSAYTDAATFKTAMSGVYLYYELATPIEYELVEPLVYSMATGTTEARISPNADGLSAPFCCDMTYDANANNDSANAQYAATAGRLYNTHKLWGQDFDGSNDVSGAISGATTINASGVVTGGSFVKSGGTSSQFLKADGSVDSNTYAKTSSLPLVFGTGRYGSAKGSDSALTASGDFSFAYGCAGPGGGTITASNNGSVAFGDAEEEGVIVSSGSGSFAAGSAFVQSTIQSSNVGSVAMGNADNGGTIRASGIGSRAIGYATNEGRIEASGNTSEAIGFADSDVAQIIASGVGSCARGCGNDAPIFASGKGSTAIGAAEVGTIRASGKGSIAIGNPTGYSEIHAKGNGSFAHGYTNAEYAVLVAYGASSHAEGAADAESISGVSGYGTSYTSSNSGKLSVGDIVFSGFYIAQVVSCTSSSFTTDVTLGSLSNTTIYLQYSAASGDNSHSEGHGTRAIGYASHSEGYYTTAKNAYEHAMGKYNASHKANNTWGNAGNTLHSIGIGTGSSAKVNAVEVMQNGDIYINGTGNYDGTNPSTADTLQQQILVLTEHIAKLTAKINTLEAEIDNRGNLTANTVDVRQGYTYNGDLLILTGSGVPTTVPAFVGQFYINTSGPSLYYAINNSAASDWKQA